MNEALNREAGQAAGRVGPLPLPPAGKLATGQASASGGPSTADAGRRVLTDVDYIEMLGPNVNGRRRHGEWFDLAWAHFGDACAYCQGLARLATRNPYGYLSRTLDHFIPESCGGSDAPHNLVPACHYCNSAKGRRDAFEWYRRQPFFTPERWARIVRYRHTVGLWDGERWTGCPPPPPETRHRSNAAQRRHV